MSPLRHITHHQAAAQLPDGARRRASLTQAKMQMNSNWGVGAGGWESRINSIGLESLKLEEKQLLKVAKVTLVTAKTHTHRTRTSNPSANSFKEMEKKLNHLKN